jgi:hypothetical protein
MRIKKFAISVFAFLILSGVLITTVSAMVWSPSLPTDLVTLKITNPYTTPLCPDSYPFIIDLTDVGMGLDITDGTYTGWCVDIDHGITRGVEYEVMLYSSYDISAPIPPENWNAINYIINNKQGTGCDVQAAIWYFINGGAYWWIVGDPFVPSESTAVQNMVEAAIANSGTYEPGVGDKLAIVCVPLETYEPPVQSVIIELEIPGESEGLTPGFWKNHPNCWVGYDPETDYFNDIFGVSVTINKVGKKPGNSNPTLMEALAAKGGVNEAKDEYGALVRHAVAALLNAAHPEVNYPLTETEIINSVANAINNVDMTDPESLKNMLDMYNNAGGGIDAHCNPV